MTYYIPNIYIALVLDIFPKTCMSGRLIGHENYRVQIVNNRLSRGEKNKNTKNKKQKLITNTKMYRFHLNFTPFNDIYALDEIRYK